MGLYTLKSMAGIYIHIPSESTCNHSNSNGISLVVEIPFNNIKSIMVTTSQTLNMRCCKRNEQQTL